MGKQTLLSFLPVVSSRLTGESQCDKHKQETPRLADIGDRLGLGVITEEKTQYAI